MLVFCFKHKTGYEMRISDWSSDVCSSDLDTSDFDNARRGLIAPLPSAMIEGQSGNPIWNPQQYSFINTDAEAPDTVNPSLWRQSQLINIGGLFEVVDGIYQVRNLDLSNMTIIEGEEGINVVDPLISAETAKVGRDLYNSHPENARAPGRE